MMRDDVHGAGRLRSALRHPGAGAVTAAWGLLAVSWPLVASPPLPAGAALGHELAVWAALTGGLWLGGWALGAERARPGGDDAG
jgi:hypothetical protein